MGTFRLSGIGRINLLGYYPQKDQSNDTSSNSTTQYELANKKLDDFSIIVINYNTWFKDTRN